MGIDFSRLEHAVGAAGLVLLVVRFVAAQFPQQRRLLRALVRGDERR